MLRVLTRYWWLVALRGVFAVIFGILALVWPVLTLSALILLFAVYALVDGISTIITGISDRHGNSRWWVLLFEGLFGIAAGIMAFTWPNVTALLLVYFIAVWALFTGVFEIIAAIRLRQELKSEWVLGLTGVLSIVFSLILMINPGPGAVALIWVIGSYAILFGGLLLYLSFKLRGRGSRPTEIDARPRMETN
jgi:uncharacterized membrane protein HdeD (DUF308 family)